MSFSWKDILGYVVLYKEELALVAAAVVSFSIQWLKKTAISLMLQAEKLAKEELELSGPEKMEAVIQLFDEKVCNGLIPESTIHWLAQKWYDEAMKA